MELHIARQPIFDANKAIIGYELLHRESGWRNEYSATDGEYASSSVITTAFLSLGQDWLTDGKPVYINFTADLLKSGVASLLPKEQLVVEVLETVAPTRDVIAACEQLKRSGYSLALDDYVLNPIFEPLAKLADIIKVDFRNVSEEDQIRAITINQGKDLQFLAEKVETEREFQRAVDFGYTLFQGYFFSRPVILAATAVPANKIGYIRLMQAVNCDNPDFRPIIAAIESDVRLSMETIKLSNSAFFGRRQKITSIRQAVVALGLDGVRKWIYLSSLRRLCVGKPDVLVSTSIIRSKFMELIAAATRPMNSAEYSMLGLFSLLDALTNCTFEAMFSELNIAENIKDILVNGNYESEAGKAFQAALTYERGSWKETADAAGQIGLTLDQVAAAYIESLRWYNEFINISNS